MLVHSFHHSCVGESKSASFVGESILQQCRRVKVCLVVSENQSVSCCSSVGESECVGDRGRSRTSWMSSVSENQSESQ